MNAFFFSNHNFFFSGESLNYKHFSKYFDIKLIEDVLFCDRSYFIGCLIWLGPIVSIDCLLLIIWLVENHCTCFSNLIPLYCCSLPYVPLFGKVRLQYVPSYCLGNFLTFFNKTNPHTCQRSTIKIDTWDKLKHSSLTRHLF